MAKSFIEKKWVRKNFGRIPSIAAVPNLIEVQKASYSQFLQEGIPFDKRTNTGLQAVLKSIFPIRDFQGRGELEFVRYELDTPKYDVDECIKRDLTYAAPLKVTMQLLVFDIDEETGAKSVRDVKEQEVYMGDIPLMTHNGTFIINGTERVIVSQMHRSPGVFFDHDEGKTHSSGKYLFAARIIPYRGSWLDFEFDAKDIVYVRVDRRRKLPVTTFLYALDSMETEEKRSAKKKGRRLDPSDVSGMSQEEILSYFYERLIFKSDKKGWKIPFVGAMWRGQKAAYNFLNAATEKVVIKADEKITAKVIDRLKEEGVKEVIVPTSELIGRYSASDIVEDTTGEILLEAAEEITEEKVEELVARKVAFIPTLQIDQNVGPYIRNTMIADKNTNREEALVDIYKVMRPGEPPTVEAAEMLFESLFFDANRYDLSVVGRVKMNSRLGFSAEEVPDTVRVLRKADILSILKILVDLKDGKGEVDDIDHLGNRRVRSVGELIENHYRIGLVRMERVIRERMSSLDIDTVMPHDLVNAKPAVAALREFFGTSQLSQFMDQTNPLSEITHKRRLSALGPGGLTRERAGFEVRDVHPTHYGRICPIETPEGQNIGLINSLATYARVNNYGFIETPYRRVTKGKATDEIVYMSAMEEGKYTIAQANELDEKGKFKNDLVDCRRAGETVHAQPAEIDFVDVSPKQVVSVAAALIPFLENDDANRALMGSNMQRQAVPLLVSEAPIIGTGMEDPVGRDSGATIQARRGGVVQEVDSTRIVIRATDGLSADKSGVDIYTLDKYQHSNQSTCINQKPIVKLGDVVRKDDIIADGASTQLGELGLGKNVLVAFMPWNGYNYEDSILISERISKDDVFTSIHLEEFEVMARDTKLGQEEITRDIPNVGEEGLRQLDESGIVYIGAEVKAGDILVGKVTPKGESPVTPEEKLLRAIFGEKATDVRDTSMRVPPGVQGTVVEVRVFNRRGLEKDERTKSIEIAEITRLTKDRDAEKAILETSYYDRLKALLVGQKVAGGKTLTKGKTITKEMLEGLSNPAHMRMISVSDDKVQKQLEAHTKTFDENIEALKRRFEDKVEKLQGGDDLPTGVLKTVKVFIAIKRKLQPGDKMAGRHGNKGIVSRVLPAEDMPFMEDGTPVDIVLNPLGLPSRMNIGQILETHLGWACRALGRQVGELLKEKAKAPEIRKKLEEIYGKKDYAEMIDSLADKDVMELAQNIAKGVPIATPVFDGAMPEDIEEMLELAGLDKSGQVQLYDGRTGEPFDRKTTVGYKYMLKLHHLVDDKIHARSIGPYSLVTQQPLGGKAQFGGQRFGEMEVWALEAYGASYTLQEMLTVKSDDVSGRTKVYESIVRGDDNFESGIPESFNVLIKEIRSLGLNMELEQTAE